MVASARLWLLGLLRTEGRLRTAELSAAQADELRLQAGSFDDIEECQTGYKELLSQCTDDEVEPERYHDDSLMSDEDGDGYLEGHGHESYLPPASRSGRPDGAGWDYRQHGKDWNQLGDCGKPGQSPIDLSRYVDVQGQTKYLLWFDYYLDPDLRKDHKAKIINDGHGLFYDVAQGGVDLGFVKIGPREFGASQYTIHAPSEHTFDGASYPLEVQILNQDRLGGVSSSHHDVVGISILFREGKSNPFLAALQGSMADHAPTWSVKDGSGVGSISGLFEDAFNLELLIPKSGANDEHSFYNYKGSLTQPPCTTNVDWWVLSEPAEASREEIRFLRRAIFGSESSKHGNNRLVQPPAGRSIFAGVVGFQHAIKYHLLPNWKELDASQAPRGYSSQDLPWGDHWRNLTRPAARSATRGTAPAPGPVAMPAAPPIPAVHLHSIMQ